MPNDTIFHRIICCINVNHIMLLPYSGHNIMIVSPAFSIPAPTGAALSRLFTSGGDCPSLLAKPHFKRAQRNPMFLH